MVVNPIGSTQACPSCETQLPVLAGYLTWCHECGWNLSAPQPLERRDRPVDRLIAVVGRRLGNRLAERLIAAGSLQPRLTPSRLASYAIAAGVHLLTLALLVGGIVVAALTFPNPFAIVLGLVFVATAWLMRPRLGKLPEEGVLERSEAPALYALVDEVAAALATPSVDVIAVSDEYNASWAIVGVRRRRVVTLGLPLTSALRPAELVALIAHELAHGRNGDVQRGIFVGSAVNGLGELYGLLAPTAYVHFANLELLARISNGVFWLVSRPVRWLLLLELHLLLRDSQRAEYLADALAADVAGTAAAVALQEKLLLAPTVDGVVQRRMHASNGDGDLFDEIEAAVDGIPERERERRRRVARLEDARLDATHPPTGLRLRLLEERPRPEPRVAADVARRTAVDAELAHFKRQFQERLVEAHRDRLYARYA
ncbi:MAG TPA: M48 family metallopeptidase [Gaiellaceae bacterium]